MKRILTVLLSLFLGIPWHVHAKNLIRDGDIIELKLSGPPEELAREFQCILIVDKGAVKLPLIGLVTAAGLTRGQLGATIEDRLKDAKVFTSAKVTVNIDSMRGKRTVTVRGGVRAPGPQVWEPGLTLTRAISTAGGPPGFGGDRMKIIRDGKAVSYSRKSIRKDPSLDPKIEPGDIIEAGDE